MTFYRAYTVGTLFLIYSCSLCLLGCKPAEGIHQVRVKAEESDRRAAKATLPTAGPDSPAAGGLKYETPAGWTVKANGPMRLASLDVIDGNQKCEVSIISLGPDQSVLDNVNRWRGQVKMAATDEATLASEMKPIQCAGHKGTLVQLVGEKDTILGVIVILPQASWFVKLQGPNALAQRELDKFVAFTESIQLP